VSLLDRNHITNHPFDQRSERRRRADRRNRWGAVRETVYMAAFLVLIVAILWWFA